MRTTIRLPRGEWQFDGDQPLGPAGGFGQVFAGVGPDGSAVAVKRLHLTADEAAHRELQIADRLQTRSLAHVVPIWDAGQDAESERYFIVMARAERSLQEEINARGALPFAEAVHILSQVADGLIEVADIVHRDLKPANVLLHEGRWKIADYGIARFLEESTSLNTLREALSPPYAAPEQWRGERAVGATDVYALGCMAHALTTGSPPFRGPHTADFRSQHLNNAAPPLVVEDARVSSLVLSMLRKTPEGRPSTTRIVAVLRAVLATPAAAVRPVAAGLQHAAAIEAAAQSRRDAEAAAVRTAAERRQRLADDGLVSSLELCGSSYVSSTTRSRVSKSSSSEDTLPSSLEAPVYGLTCHKAMRFRQTACRTRSGTQSWPAASK